jgi:hypothetical protein
MDDVRWLLAAEGVRDDAEEAAAICDADPEARVVIYDGDSGRPVLSMGAHLLE